VATSLLRGHLVETRMLGSLWPVSVLTLGGGGIGQVWGSTSRDESVATVRAAVEGGIMLIDVAPSYGDGEAEEVVGAAFAGSLPSGVRVSTKHHVGHDPAEVEAKMIASLDASLERLRLDFVDVFLLHSQVVPQPDPEREAWTTPLELFEDAARPALQKLVDGGRVGAWGITAVQFPEVLDAVFAAQPSPQVAQMVANAIDSPGDMSWTPASTEPRQLVAQAQQAGVGVMGIRAVQAGALTDRLDRDLPLDHPARLDFERADPFRRVAAELGQSAAVLAHRYALSMEDVDTVVLGVKNRSELAECLAAAEAGPLPPEVIELVDRATAPLR
jgi:aryl-alcohol dehydrogenase-like predicted oxidoreductase